MKCSDVASCRRSQMQTLHQSLATNEAHCFSQESRVYTLGKEASLPCDSLLSYIKCSCMTQRLV